jgi:hypothetical protein
VGSVSIGKILADMKAPQTIDYLSLDIEGSEFMVLSSFPFWRPTSHSRQSGNESGSGGSDAGGGGGGEEGGGSDGQGPGSGYRLLVVTIENPGTCVLVKHVLFVLVKQVN